MEGRKKGEEERRFVVKHEDLKARDFFHSFFFFLHGGPHARHTGERCEIKLKMYDLFKSGHGPLPMLVDASRAVFAYVHS